MLKRRAFLIFSSWLGVGSLLKAKRVSKFKVEFQKLKPTIEAVQEHMFPNESKLPSAKDIRAIDFLYETINHKSYDKDIKRFILEGASLLLGRTEGKFNSMTKFEKEVALRSFEESSKGSLWLNRIMILTMEAMFSDPIYGSNKNEIGWRSISSYGGYPRAKRKYMGL